MSSPNTPVDPSLVNSYHYDQNFRQSGVQKFHPCTAPQCTTCAPIIHQLELRIQELERQLASAAAPTLTTHDTTLLALNHSNVIQPLSPWLFNSTPTFDLQTAGAVGNTNPDNSVDLSHFYQEVNLSDSNFNDWLDMGCLEGDLVDLNQPTASGCALFDAPYSPRTSANGFVKPAALVLPAPPSAPPILPINPPTTAAPRFNCTGCMKTFSRKGDRDRHALVHAPGPRGYPCTAAGCSKSYYRMDKLRVHQKKHHG
ncbi:hypothetical protein HYFRA_00004299 [Hymenoscyphus fraxineus]|uniref:C2H2 type master regulator of conidiophore development brlA n=1 Tax=Hymenoscyphus fraxineus TaxID=746836 RepID=A0A9N9KQ10_9HELO|nr:hypothetical protein HYFRA_00004299 [Hymenoscyphus fraxineus]